MRDCKITNLNREGYSLGRSWGGKSKLAWIGTTMNEQPLNEGNSIKRFTLNGMNIAAYQFKEYASKDEQGNILTPQKNVVTFTHSTGNYTYNTTMSADSAALFTLDKVFPDWQPADLTAQATSPDVKLNGKTLSWTASSTVAPNPWYAVFKDNELLTITQSLQYTLKDVANGAIYSVRTANAMGGFSEPTSSSGTTNLRNLSVNDKEVVRTNYFRPDGTACNAQTQGMVVVVQAFADGSVKACKRIVR